MNQVPIIRVSDRRMGIIGAIVFLLITFFILFFFTFSEPDPPIVTIPIPVILGEQGITDFEINNGGGGGAPSENANPVPEPQENPKEQPTQDESPVTVPTSDGDAETDNPPTEEAAPVNPFPGDNAGENGISGTSDGLGKDTGPGKGTGDPGKGTKVARVRLGNIHSKPKTQNDERCKIAFKLTVDNTGKVLRADVLRNGTTATNQQLIEEVIALVKDEVKYKPKPGSINETLYYTVTVQPG